MNRKLLFITLAIIVTIVFGIKVSIPITDSAIGSVQSHLKSESKMSPIDSAETYSGNDLVAHIEKNSIKIEYVGDHGKTEGLYWKGTWKPGLQKIHSKGDLAAMENEMFASMNEYKNFQLKGDTLIFTYKLMGHSEKTVMHKK